MKSAVRVGLVLAVLGSGASLTIIAVAGGGDEPATIVRSAGSAAAPVDRTLFQPTMDDAGVVTEWVPMSINRLVNETELGVIGTVTAVSTPRWNSPDGSPWAARLDQPVPAFKYRDVTVQVERMILQGNGKWPAAEGKTVTVYVPGDGTHTGAQVSTPAGTLLFNDRNGEFEPGSRMVLLLHTEPLLLSDGTNIPRLALTASYQANWRINDKNEAMSKDAQRTTPLDALLKRIEAERNKGHKPVETRAERDKTTRNPLGDESSTQPAPQYPSEQRPLPSGDPIPAPVAPREP